MNNFNFTGNLGNDCRTGQAGQTAVVNFSVAVKSGYGQNEQTVWVDCALFGNRATALAPYLTKGQTVAVSGELGTREHNGKTYITCKVNDVTLVGGKQQGNAGYQQAPQQQQQQQQAWGQQQQQAPQGFNNQLSGGQPSNAKDDDVPFMPHFAG